MAVMRRVLVVSACLAALAAPPAAAQSGVNLSWNDCGTAGAAERNWPCSASTGGQLIVGSFVAPAGVIKLTGIEVVLEVQSAAPVLPDWWQFRSGGCRQGQLSANFLYSGSSCLDYWADAGGAMGGLAAYAVGSSGPNTARVTLVAAVDQLQAVAVRSGGEYFAFNLAINNARTSGPGACAGCGQSACVVLNSIRLTQPLGVGDFALNGAANRNFVVWQGGGAGTCHGAGTKQNATFGQLKSLYRN